MFLKVLNKLSSMSQRKILALAGATGATMFGLVYTTLSSAVDTRAISPTAVEIEAPPPIQTVGVVTAAVDIPAQTIIQESMLKTTQVPQDMVSTTAVRDPSKLVGKVTRVDVLADDIMTDKKFFHNAEQIGFVGMIPPDCRAISIGISDITSVSGFIDPGDYVDVMMVYESGGEIHSEIILQNVLVLAMGKKAVQTYKEILEGAAAGTTNVNGNAGEKSTSMATLALHSDEILQIAAAARKGTLYLVMRPFRPDSEYVSDVAYSLSSKSSSSSTPFGNFGLDELNEGLENAQASASTRPASSADRPVPAFQPPASPVVNKPNPSTPTYQPPRTVEPPEDQGIEIIQGDKVIKN